MLTKIYQILYIALIISLPNTIYSIDRYFKIPICAPHNTTVVVVTRAIHGISSIVPQYMIAPQNTIQQVYFRMEDSYGSSYVVSDYSYIIRG